MSLVHPLARVLGKGSAKSGIEHWWVQRVTAVALVPLNLWLVWSLVGLREADHATVSAWMQHPINAALLITWVAVMLHHAQLGLQVVVEDYVHNWLEMPLQLLIKFVYGLGIVIAVLGILRVFL